MRLFGLKEKVHIDIEGKKIVITPAVENAREGWEEMIKDEVQKKGQPERLMPDVFEEEQNDEWEW